MKIKKLLPVVLLTLILAGCEDTADATNSTTTQPQISSTTTEVIQAPTFTPNFTNVEEMSDEEIHTEVKELEQEIASLETELAEIQVLENEIANLEAELSELEVLEAQIAALEKELSEMDN